MKYFSLYNSRILELLIKDCESVMNMLYYMYVIPYGEGNGTPLQYFCLENPMDGGSW